MHIHLHAHAPYPLQLFGLSVVMSLISYTLSLAANLRKEEQNIGQV